MKHIILSLFAILTFCSCGNKTSNQFCVFLEEATERMEKATSTNEIEEINDKLIKNISIYSMSLKPEEYQKWADDKEAQKELEAAKLNYQEAKAAKEKELKGE